MPTPGIQTLWQLYGKGPCDPGTAPRIWTGLPDRAGRRPKGRHRLGVHGRRVVLRRLGPDAPGKILERPHHSEREPSYNSDRTLRLGRHPIYSGLILALFGTAITLGTIPAFAGFAFMLISFVRKLKIEETWLRSQFGAEYEVYQNRVKALIPRF
jgi:Phospholipid methyltransferase